MCCCIFNCFKRRSSGKPPRAKPALPWLPPTAIHDADSWRPVQQLSGFFGLPYEIRYEILRLAFGDCVVHIDMRPGPAWPVIRSDGSVAEPGYRARRRVIWRWTNGFCHRDAKYEDTHDASEKTWRACLDGQANCSGREYGSNNGKFQGAMSFLLSSKQRSDRASV